MAITIALCEDEAVQIAALRKLLTQWSADKPFALNIHEYTSAESFLFSYADKPCDLLLLDIEMKGLDGIALAKKLRAEGDMLPIIFVTGYSDYMSEGYEVEALHYLLKPVVPEKLFAVLDRYIKKQKQEPGLLLQCEDKTMHILPDAILYCEASGKKTQIYLKDSRVKVLILQGRGARVWALPYRPHCEKIWRICQPPERRRHLCHRANDTV